MYEKISEPIEVMVAFRGSRPEPIVFKWNRKIYRVSKVNLMHTERRGREKFYIFSVSDETNAYRLSFSGESLKWNLEEMAML
ncbi:MAG: hypothetical protein NUV81_02745 [bacterium]|nr:hypothetical protein [bacterium]